MTDFNYTAAVITVSDKGFTGEREDTSGPAVSRLLTQEGWDVCYRTVVPDDMQAIKDALTGCSDKGICLILTTGGTGFSQRDITPEATMSVIERPVPGIPEAMRGESMKITPMGMLSRAAAGIRGCSLIVNLPGSEKAALECIGAVVPALKHAVEMLCAKGSTSHARVAAVCISEKKGVQKHEVSEVRLVPNHGIDGDAHAGNWHRQVSLLGVESVKKLQDAISFKLEHGAFAENILVEGITVYKLPVGTKLKIGTALAEVTQIGKECHNDCAIRKAAGDCVMPREGIFVKILSEGTVKAGDAITVEG